MGTWYKMHVGVLKVWVIVQRHTDLVQFFILADVCVFVFVCVEE